MQQSLVQVFVPALQHAAQSAHFSAAEALTAKAATEAAAMRVRMVFIVLCLYVFLRRLLWRFRRAAQAGACRVCHRVAV